MHLIRPLLLAGVILFHLQFSLVQGAGFIATPTKGEIWPKPKSQLLQPEYWTLHLGQFKINIVNNTCSILDVGIKRYQTIIAQFKEYAKEMNNFKEIGDEMFAFDSKYFGYLKELKVNLKNECEEYPYLEMDESYELSIQTSTAHLKANSIWGILRGLESFSQLIYTISGSSSLLINSTVIADAPRFPHRGLLVDTARHYLSLQTIIKILDGMSYNKFNVFHWHIVDDESFPYVSGMFPELSAKGAYHQTQIYTPQDVQQVIEEARLRGIRVIPEFDTPGHATSWGKAHPELMIDCVGNDLIDPTKNTTYEFMQNLFKEINNIFPDKYVHMGGDEVDLKCWERNHKVVKFMRSQGMYSARKLEEFYIQKVCDIVESLGVKSIVWQEVFQNGVRLGNRTIVHAWLGNPEILLRQITEKKMFAILSECWYLDNVGNGGDWNKFYKCDPHRFQGSAEQKRLVLGGEACMWGEFVDDSNVIQRIFPRASATAEKLWSSESTSNQLEAALRLEEHYCRMRMRGIPAQPPNGAGYCIA